MSEKLSTGLVIVEKIFGVIILIVGVLMSYYTYNNMQAAGLGANLFFAVGIMLAIIGLTLVITRTK